MVSVSVDRLLSLSPGWLVPGLDSSAWLVEVGGSHWVVVENLTRKDLRLAALRAADLATLVALQGCFLRGD